MRLVLLIYLLLPTVADAAPVLVAAGVAAGTAATIVTVARIALIVGMAIYGSAQQRRAERQKRAAYNAGLQDRTITGVSTDTAYRYVYGRARVGSLIVAMFTTGDKDQYRHLVCLHAAHECDGFEEIYIAGKSLGTLDADGAVTGGDYYSTAPVNEQEDKTGSTFDLTYTPDAGSLQIIKDLGGDSGDQVITPTSVDGTTVTLDADYGSVSCCYTHTVGTPRVRVQMHLGTADDPVDAYLHALLPTKWPATATLDGFTYTIVTLDLNQPEFQSGLTSVEALLRGKKLYDQRTDTTAWSQNPALVIRDYLASEMCGVDTADIPSADLIAAANVCDESVESAEIYGESGTRYTFNGVVTADQPQPDVLEKMAQSMAGGIVSTTWSMWAGKYVAPVLDLYIDKPGDMGDMVGQIAITPGISDADLYNGVKGQYISPENSYVATDFEPYQNSTYVTTDGAEKWTNIDFPFTDNKQRAWNLCRIFTEDQRNGFTVTADFSLKAWSLRVGNRVRLFSTLFGWDGKVFRVTDKKYSPTSAVQLTLKEDAESIWDFADEALADATPNTNLPPPYAIDPLSALTCTSGNATLAALQDGTIIPRIKVSWPEATTQAVATNGQIEIEWQRAGGTWQKVQISGSETETYLAPVEERRVYIVRARTVNQYFNVKSAWLYTSHQVVGKSALPPDVTGFAVSVLSDATRRFAFDTSNQPADVLHGGGYRIKYRASDATTAWADMTALHSGLITQSPFETRNPAAGSYDFAIAAVDGSGNESETAALVSDVTIADTSTAATALANAATAQAAAEAAQHDADTANAALTIIASDNVLSIGEKPKLIADINPLLDEFVKNRLQADAFSISHTAYDAAIWQLYDYLGTLAPSYDNLFADTAIDGAVLRQKFANAYAQRTALLNAISTKASTTATWSGVVGSDGKLATGSTIFDAGAVGTDDLADAAATDIIYTTDTAIDCWDYVANTWAQGTVSLYYTASVSGIAEVSAKGDSSTKTYVTGSAGGGATSFVIAPGMQVLAFENGSSSSMSGSVAATPPSKSQGGAFDCDMSMSARFSLTAGSSYEFRFTLFGKGQNANADLYGPTINALLLAVAVVKK